MLRPFLQHIEAFFSQEIREISCKAIFDSGNHPHFKIGCPIGGLPQLHGPVAAALRRAAWARAHARTCRRRIFWASGFEAEIENGQEHFKSTSPGWP